MTGIARGGLLLLPILAFLAVAPLFAKEGRTMTEMRMTSPAFVHTKAIPSAYSCDGENLNPPLAIEGVPPGAKSLALVMDDPDAPAGVWVHWVLWNIDPGTRQIAQGSAPAAAQQGMNSWGKRGYGGPCPPSGTHRYYFRLFALKERLDLPATAARKDLDRAMQGKILARSELLGLYSRK
jgi:Raf kinase inhibitor-like YbhB/YbcL family protein